MQSPDAHGKQRKKKSKESATDSVQDAAQLETPDLVQITRVIVSNNSVLGFRGQLDLKSNSNLNEQDALIRRTVHLFPLFS